MTKFSLTPTILAKSYDLLRSTPPFDKWNLPEPEDITFKVRNVPHLRGQYVRYVGGKHEIMMSSANIDTLQWLTMTMGHEMIHLHQGETGMETKAQHNTAFKKLAERVSRIHTWDRKMF